jgi:hypothetical protein
MLLPSPYCVVILSTAWGPVTSCSLEYFTNKPSTKFTLHFSWSPSYIVSILSLHSTPSHLLVYRRASYTTYSLSFFLWGTFLCILWRMYKKFMNIVLTMSVYPSVSLSICLSTREPVPDSDEIWYRHYATGGYPKLALLQFLQLIPYLRVYEKHSCISRI